MGFQLEKNGFRDLCVSLRVFFGAVKLMKFYFPFTLGSPYDISFWFYSKVRNFLRKYLRSTASPLFTTDTADILLATRIYLVCSNLTWNIIELVQTLSCSVHPQRHSNNGHFTSRIQILYPVHCVIPNKYEISGPFSTSEHILFWRTIYTVSS